LSRVALAPNGQRNATLNRAAFALGQFVGAGTLDRAYLEERLTDAASRCGLDAREIANTIRSGIDAGIAQPRQKPKKTGRNSRQHAQGPPTESTQATTGEETEAENYKPRPRIDAGNGDLEKVTDQAWKAIHQANEPPSLFRFGGAPARIEHDDKGNPITNRMNEDRMRHRLARDTG
jgi:hypothetical protein